MGFEQQAAPEPVAFPAEVQAVVEEILGARFTGLVEHDGEYVDVVARHAGLDFTADQVVDAANAVDDGIARRAGFNGNETEWNWPEGCRDFVGERTEPAQNLLKSTSVSEVVIAGVEQQGARICRRYEIREEVIAGFERRPPNPRFSTPGPTSSASVSQRRMEELP